MKRTVFFGLLTIVLAFGLIGCGGDDGGDPVINTYEGTAGSDTYVLKINVDDNTYELTVGGKTSKGTAAKNGDTWTLTPNGEGEAFKVTVNSSGGITEMDGTITFTDGSPSQEAPAAITPKPPSPPNSNTPGKLTVTGIPAEYNGKYMFILDGGIMNDGDVLLMNDGDGDVLFWWAAASINTNSKNPDELIASTKCGRISGGSVTLNVWEVQRTQSKEGEDTILTGVTNFNRSGAAEFVVGIIDTETLPADEDLWEDALVAGAVLEVTFTNGIGSAADAEWFDDFDDLFDSYSNEPEEPDNP